eukprot:scaffold154539_cov24-Tisochrysis_lutea.AAC.7
MPPEHLHRSAYTARKGELRMLGTRLTSKNIAVHDTCWLLVLLPTDGQRGAQRDVGKPKARFASLAAVAQPEAIGHQHDAREWPRRRVRRARALRAELLAEPIEKHAGGGNPAPAYLVEDHRLGEGWKAAHALDPAVTPGSHLCHIGRDGVAVTLKDEVGKLGRARKRPVAAVCGHSAPATQDFGVDFEQRVLALACAVPLVVKIGRPATHAHLLTPV